MRRSRQWCPSFNAPQLQGRHVLTGDTRRPPRMPSGRVPELVDSRFLRCAAIRTSNESVTATDVAENWFGPREPNISGGSCLDDQLAMLRKLVEAGAPLCLLMDYGELYLQGRAFEHDADELLQADRELPERLQLIRLQRDPLQS